MGWISMMKLPTNNTRNQLPLLILLAGISLAVYLSASGLVLRIGFPLDDAWIHQTYARNLAQHGEWAFIPGQPSAGSTAPLWSLLLALGYFLHLGPYIWTYLLGWFCLVAVAWQGRSIFQTLAPSRSGIAIWAALFLVVEYHLVWAAVSGMETLFYAWLLMAVFAELVQPGPRWARVGLLVGLSVWVRPDGLTLLGPALLVLYFIGQDWPQRWRSLVSLLVGMGALVVCYALFNLRLSGNWLPNTFFAKQAEYAIYRQLPLWKRFVDQASLPLVGAGMLLLPGLVLFFIRAVRQQRWPWLAGIAWLVGYWLLYALRLPVTYQHGRYIIPSMPVYFIWSLAGIAGWVQFSYPVLWKKSLSKAWVYSLVLVLILFWGLGAQTYAQDVAIIESEMVATARWVAQNTSPQALIAAHDIGALGYFSERRLLDLAGLVSPEVIPFLRDEVRLQQYLDEKQADYLVTFPGWYPHLVGAGRLVFTTQGEFSLAAGGENMSVYALK
jgi:arabinofuranosyltransferase